VCGDAGRGQREIMREREEREKAIMREERE